MKPIIECCRFEVRDGLICQIMTHSRIDGVILLQESEPHIVPSTYPIYLKWCALGNIAPIINTPISDSPPKYAPIPDGVLSIDWRRHLYTMFVDVHVIASVSYTLEGDTAKADVEKAIAIAEKTAIRIAFPDSP